MMLNEPRSAERDNQNSLRKYPFADCASCTARTGVIPPGAILDAQLYVPGREPGQVWMSSIDTDGKLHFSDAAGEFAVLSARATPDSAVPVTFTGDGGPCHGGLVVFGKAADVSSLLSLGGQRFTARQTELAPAAVSWPGLPGVLGFRLDDGNVVYGDVKIVGDNGCVVATFVDGDGRRRLRISAMGQTAEGANTSGFVTRVIMTSDNTTFVVTPDEASDKVVDVTATGVSTLLDDGLNADQDNMCDKVRAKLGTVPSRRTTHSAACEDGICVSATETRKVRLFDGDGARVVWTPNQDDSFIAAMKGLEMDKLLSSQIARPSRVVPYDAEVEYIVSNGTAGFEVTFDNSVTVIEAGDTHEASLRWWQKNDGGWGQTFRANGFLGSQTLSLRRGMCASRPQFQIAATVSDNIADETWHEWRETGSGGSVSVILDGTEIMQQALPVSMETIFLFMNQNHGSMYSGGKCRFAGYTARKNGVVVADVVPVRIGTTGTIYDKVARRFPTVVGTGSFGYGGDTYVPPSGDNALRFAGYYDSNGVMYYRYDGTPVRPFDRDGDLDLYARFVSKSSSAEVTFENYGTLHLAAPNVEGYTNPIRISGLENPVPVVREYSDQVVEAGGADAIADIMLHPAVPSGEVHIGLRGADKVSML